MRLVDKTRRAPEIFRVFPRVFLVTAIGHVTSSVGLCLVLGMAISGLPMEKLMKPLVPFLEALIAVLLLVAFVGETVLFIPRLLGFVK